MRKEILLAIFVGLLVGLAITFGVYTVRQHMLRSKTVSEIEASRQLTATATPQPQLTLALNEPSENLITDKTAVPVAGRAIPMSYVVIMVGTQEFITTADKDGDFAQTVNLQPDGNLITVTATTPEGKQETIARTVIYNPIPLTDLTATLSGQKK
jgi:hypothetical protein